MISFPKGESAEPEPEAQVQRRTTGDFDYSRWDSIGADEEDEDPNLRNLDPEQREAMKAKVKNMESMLEAMRGGDMAGVSARLTGSAGGQAATVKGHDDPAIAAIIAETEVKALLDRMTDEESAKAVVAEVKADPALTAKFQQLAKAGVFGSKAPRPRAPPPRTLIECVPPEHRASLKELTPDGGCLLRTIEEPAAPGERARPRAKCNFEFRAEYFSGTERHPVDIEKDGWEECPGGGIRLGKNFKIQGWEQAVANMQVGETAEVYCAPRYAEGFADMQMVMLRAEHAKGCPGGASALLGCPACNPELTSKQMEFQNSGRLARDGEPLVFTIRLTSIEQFDVTVAEFWELDVESKIQAAEQWRVQGNAFFTDANYAEASKLYHKAVSYLETLLDTTIGPMADESDENTALAKRLTALKIPLHLNRAAAFLKLQSFVEAGQSCEKVLADEPENVKAIFRLGQVFNGLHEYDKAERHWKHAALLARKVGNEAVAKSAEKEIEKMKRGKAKSKAREKKLAAKMLSSSSSSSSKPKVDDKDASTLKVTFTEPGSLGLKFAENSLTGRAEVLRINPGTQAQSHPQRSQLQVGLLLESVQGVSVVGKPYGDVLSMLKNGARPLTLAFVQRQEKPLDNALGAADLTGVDALAQVRAEAAAAVNAPLDVESDELLPPTVLKAQDEASKAERERLEAEAEVAALQAELVAAEEMLRVKREAKKRHDEEVELARAAAENSPSKSVDEIEPEPEPEPQPQPKSQPVDIGKNNIGTIQETQEALDAARKQKAAQVVAEVIAEDDSGTSSDESEARCNSDDSEGGVSPDEAVTRNQSAELGKLDREGLLELCEMMMAADANDDQDKRADDAACYVDDAIALFADERGEVAFDDFEDWWSKIQRPHSRGDGTAVQEHQSESRTAADRAEGLDSMEDRFAAAQAAIIASLNASSADLANEDAIAAAIAAADAAVGSPTALSDATTATTTTKQRRKDAAMVVELLRQEGASEEAIAAVSRAATPNKLDPVSRRDEEGMMKTYLQAGAVGMFAAVVAWVAQTSMMSG